MTSITGIPTTRVSTQFVRDRMLAQIEFDQSELFRLQTQLSTGHRYQVPSEEPISAMRVIGLQRLLERKEQAYTNRQTSQSFLSITDAALSTTSNLLSEARGLAISNIGEPTSNDMRRAAARQIQQITEQLVETGNMRFRGRYLFAGSSVLDRPFQLVGSNGVEYVGNEQDLMSFVDIDQLAKTNLTGQQVFGVISSEVRGDVDFDPVLTYDTRLADLQRGEGISPGSIAVSDGANSTVIDISGAETIGDVAALIRANPPSGRRVDVEVTDQGLTLQLDSAPGNLLVTEVGGGTTAAELGIFNEVGLGNAPLVGNDLEPILRPTTSLDNIFGTRSRVALRFPGDDNDLFLQADTRGADLNGVTVRLINDPSVTTGNETVAYDDILAEIEIHIDEYATTAAGVIDAVNEANALGAIPFTASQDPSEAVNDGWGLVFADDPAGVTSGGSGFEPDLTSGIQVRNGAETYTISLASAETVEDVLNILNGAGAGLTAEINESADGLNVRTRLSGVDFAIGENGGETATHLGIRSMREDTALSTLNFGRGVNSTQAGDGTDFVITRRDGVALQIDVDGSVTIDDVIALINNHPDNTPLVPGDPPDLTARLNAFGNGIELIDTSVGPDNLTVERSILSSAAIDLGLIALGEDVAVGDVTGQLSGRDTAVLETDGVFTSLLRLREGLLANDPVEIGRAVEILERSQFELNFARAELGASQQALDVLATRHEDEEVELRQTLSLEYDADFAEVVSNLAAREVAYQASLQATSRVLQQSLLDYL